MAKLKRDVFDVFLDPGDGTVDPDTGAGARECRVILNHADQLRAELEGGKRAIPTNLSIHMTSLMLWAACTRLGHYGGDYQAFRTGGLVEYARVPWSEITGEEEQAVSAAVDPTPAGGPSGPASPSPVTSPESTGSTPTPTPV